MNATATLSVIDPLPAILDQPLAAPARRHYVGRYCLAEHDLDDFNRLLARLGRGHDALDCDRIATAARQLDGSDKPFDRVTPACIGQLMRRGTALACMTGDPGWEPANDAGDIAALVIDYVRRRDDLIPDGLPTVGRLDDAIVIRTAWPRLSDEVAGYLDFCRVRRIEAALRGRDDMAFGFDRNDWEEARRAEAALAEHQRMVRASSYLPRPAMLFSVH